MSDEKVYSEEEIIEKLSELPGWELRDGWLRRSFKTPGWPHTLMLVNAIGYRAEAGFHHPDLEVGWARVVVRLQTHSAGGITDKDFSLARGALPKHREAGLHLLRDPNILEHGTEAIEELAAGLRDRNFRLFAEDGEIHVASSEGLVRGKDPFEIFDQLTVDDPSHAFYLGYEMAKAITALTLNKNYVQDEALRWGFLTREEKSHLDRRKERPEK